MNLKRYTSSEISATINGSIVLWNTRKLIRSFCSNLNFAIKESIYFLFDPSIPEGTLISRLVNALASGVVCQKGSYAFDLAKWHQAGLGIIEVPSLTDGFVKMASLYTSNADIPIIQVIGSSGKTTTKEMVGAILKYNMPSAVGAENFNTAFGIAEHISFLRDTHKAAVYEAGMGARGVIRLSTRIINPTIGIVTCIHRAHLMKLGGDMSEIIAAKSEILEYLAEDGYLIINGEDENCRRFPVEKYKGHVRTFGFSSECDIWASDIEIEDFKTNFIVHTRNMRFGCTINTIGKYNVANALAAIQAALIVGIEPENIVKGIASFTPYPSRLEVIKGVFNTIIINDNFNANPDSTRLLLEEVNNISKNRPLILVMGDMENPKDEIREYARKVHFQIGQLIGKLNIQYLFAIGKWAMEYANGAASSGMDYGKIFYFKTAEEAKEKLLNCIGPRSVIIFKGSVTYVDLNPLINKIIAEDEDSLVVTEDNEKIDLRNSANRTLIIDIDSVLAEEDNGIPISERALIKGARDSLNYLKEKGFRIVLYTSRFEWQREETIAWLEENKLPFDKILFEKPRALLYIDDRGYRFNSWKQFWNEVIL